MELIFWKVWQFLNVAFLMPIIRSALIIALLGLVFAALAKAQHEHAYVPPPDIPKSWAQHLWFEEGPFVEPYDMDWGDGIQFPITTAKKDTQTFFRQGWALLAAGWNEEAVRSFRYALYQDPQCAMALWALGMASLSDIDRARTFIQEIPSKAKLSELEASFIVPLREALKTNTTNPDWKALSQAYSNFKYPEAHVAASLVYRCFPDAAGAAEIESWLKEILTNQPSHPIRAYVINQPRWHSLVPAAMNGLLPEQFAQAHRFVRLGKPKEALLCFAKAIPTLAEYAILLRQLPSRWPRYVSALSETARLLVTLGHNKEAELVIDHLRSLPRHPSSTRLEEALSTLLKAERSTGRVENIGDVTWIHELSFDGWAGLTWELPMTSGEPVSTSDFINKDVLLIFYLGKGCVHCLEQLQAFAPETQAFRSAGIEVVAISLDSTKGLKATLDLADNPFPFPLVSDPELAIFRAYDAYDPFDRAPIHGTFFVSKSGLVKWTDVGHEPFMKPRWLLEECQRLQKFDTSLPTIDY